jgi:hypothetical protein
MTIDERLEFLLRSTETLHADSRQLHAAARESTRQHEITLESLQRLERIAVAHEDRLDDDDERLGDIGDHKG